MWGPTVCWSSDTHTCRFWRLWRLLEVQLRDHWGGSPVPLHQRWANDRRPLCVQRGRFVHGADTNATSCVSDYINTVLFLLRSSPYIKSCMPMWGPGSWRSTRDTSSQTDLCQPTSSVSWSLKSRCCLYLYNKRQPDRPEDQLVRVCTDARVKVLLPLWLFIVIAPSGRSIEKRWGEKRWKFL